MATIKELVLDLLREVKAALKDYMHEASGELKRRLKRVLLFSITSTILLALAVTSFGSASLFLLIGGYKYLRQTMPAWAAWNIMGLTAIAIGSILIAVLYLIIRKQLKTNPKTETPTQPTAAK